MRTLLPLIVLCGCASPHTRYATLSCSSSAAYEAVCYVLAAPDQLALEIAARDADRRIVETRWKEWPGTDTQGLIFQNRYRERSRYRVRVTEEASDVSRITVSVQRERRAPGGRRAYRWDRVEPRAEDYDIVIERVIRQVELDRRRSPSEEKDGS